MPFVKREFIDPNGRNAGEITILQPVINHLLHGFVDRRPVHRECSRHPADRQALGPGRKELREHAAKPRIRPRPWQPLHSHATSRTIHATPPILESHLKIPQRHEGEPTCRLRIVRGCRSAASWADRLASPPRPDRNQHRRFLETARSVYEIGERVNAVQDSLNAHPGPFGGVFCFTPKSSTIRGRDASRLPTQFNEEPIFFVFRKDVPTDQAAVAKRLG